MVRSDTINLTGTLPPHEGSGMLMLGEAPGKATAALILIHGRGADPDSMRYIASALERQGLAVIIPAARGGQWYPHRFIEDREMNEPGLSSGLRLIHLLVDNLAEAGIPAERIYIGGFSQGACLALEYASRHPQRLGGAFAFSGGLIGRELDNDGYSGDLEGTPVFLGCSDVDFHIPLERVKESTGILESLGGRMTERIYPGMGHTVNQDEIDHVTAMMAVQSAG